jgi:hypothetical protein
MKTKISSFCFFVFLFFRTSFLYSQTQDWQWGREPGKNYDSTFGTFYSNVTTDKLGNAYLTGYYEVSIAFGKDTLRELGSYGNPYLVKYDTNGNVVWAIQPRQGSKDHYSGGWGVANFTDNSGNIYWMGYVYDTLYFGIYKVVAPTYLQKSLFIAKYNSSGLPLWAKLVNIYPYGLGYSISTDNLDNVYITGDSDGTSRKAFITKFNSNGTQLWARSSTYISGQVIANYITTDKSGSSYMTGEFGKGSTIFGTDTFTTNFNFNAYLVKFDSSGNFQWARHPITKAGFDTLSGKAICYGSAVSTDNVGNVYLAGWFDDTLVFGSNTLSAAPGNDTLLMYLVKYDSQGNVIWAKQSSIGYLSVPWSLAVDSLNHIYLGGNAQADIRFQNLVLQGNTLDDYYSFIIEFDTTGKVLCGSALSKGSWQYNISMGVASDPTGKYVYLAGTNHQGDTIFCGPDTLVSFIGANYNPYLARWSPCNYISEGINEVKGEIEKVKVYPNPNNGVFTIRSSVVNGQSSVEIYNVFGQKVYSRFSVFNSQLVINISNQPNGVYLYRISTTDGSLIGEGKVVVQK